MNQTELRRQQLLEETRNLYSDKYKTAAIHPRYGSRYSEPDVSKKESKGTFGIRMILCILLFAMFLTMDYTNNTMFHISSSSVKDAIAKHWEMDDML